MSDKKVLSMAEKTNNSLMQTPEQVLNECLDYLGKEGAFKNGKKLLVLVLDDIDGNYDVSFVQSGMKMSECVTLSEVAKTIFMHEMGYV